MSINVRPTPGLYRRWQICLKGALVAFGVVAFLGVAALAFDPYSEPAELRRLQQVIECGNFADYNLQDLRRMDELEKKFAAYPGIDFSALGHLLLNVGLRLFAACVMLIAAQKFVRWIWLGRDPKTAQPR